jgi:YfdX protein
MLRARPIVVALAASTMLTSVALAADQSGKTANTDTANSSAAQQMAEKDFGKLSADGSKAFREVRLARLAIFDGQADQAKKYVDEARTTIAKAKSDDTVFMKEETSLKPPAGMNQKTSPSQAGTQGAAPGNTPTAWLPINGGMTLGEDFAATPDKAASVAKANEQLKKGDHRQAMETLKLSNINVAFVMEVAPVDKTVSGIDNAAQLVDSGKYYEGNQALKSVEDGTRFDVVDASAPLNTTGASTKASGAVNQKDTGDAAPAGSGTSGATSSTTTAPHSK